jgi:hypothetical protein
MVKAAQQKVKSGVNMVNDTGNDDVFESSALRGTPIPEEWTPNGGKTQRPMEVGMEVRLGKRQVFRVVSASPTSAILEGGLAVSLYGHSWYRRSRTADERGIDSDTYAVLDYPGRSGHNSTNRQEEDEMAKVAGVPVGNKKAAKKAASSRAPKQSKAAKTVRDCICGCGGKTGGAFVPGHDARFKGWLIKIAKGESKPSDLMSASLAQRLGPWKDKGEGKIPSKTYKDLLEG